jgi:hypothetical protein
VLLLVAGEESVTLERNEEVSARAPGTLRSRRGLEARKFWTEFPQVAGLFYVVEAAVIVGIE